MQNTRASKKQQELLQFIDGFIKGNGYGPSYREVMRALDYKSVSTVAIHIDQLITKGYLEKKDNSARSLSVVTLRPAESATKTKKDELIALLRHIIETCDDQVQKDTLSAALEIIETKK